MNGIPISEFASQSPDNAAIVEKLFEDLNNGSINMCACMGPIADDPHCPCTMRRMGLEPTNIWTPEKIAELHAALDFFGPKDGAPQTECPICGIEPCDHTNDEKHYAALDALQEASKLLE